MCVRANAMFRVPSVTMNAGSLIPVTRAPFSRPKATQAAIPRTIARIGLTPLSTASFVITTEPSAMPAPFDRSMPAVRMTSVWPIASVPTSIVCWRTSERLPPVRKRSLFSVKKAPTRISATNGPSAEMPKRRVRNDGPASASGTSPSGARGVVSTTISLHSRTGRPAADHGSIRRRQLLSSQAAALAPAVREAECDVLRRHALRRLVRDQRHAGGGVAVRLRFGLRVLHDGRDAEARHLQRVLLRGRGDLARLDAADARAPAVDRHDRHLLLLAGGLERGVRAERRRLVDRVEEVDVGVLLDAVLHRRLPLRLVALRVLAADDPRVLGEALRARRRLRVAHAGQEAVVAGDVDRHACGREVERRDLRLLRPELRLRVLPDQE